MKIAIVLGILVTPVLALAQVASSTVTAGDLLASGSDVVNAWKMVGWMGGIIALIKMLIDGTKFGPIGAWIKKKGLKWLRPVLALAAAGFAGFVSSFQTGVDVWVSIVAGFGAGMGSVGFHELLEYFRGRNKES